MLTRGFFEYFARKFPWDTHIVSVTSPGLVPKVCVCQGMSRCARLYLGMYGCFWVCGSVGLGVGWCRCVFIVYTSLCSNTQT